MDGCGGRATYFRGVASPHLTGGSEALPLKEVVVDAVEGDDSVEGRL